MKNSICKCIKYHQIKSKSFTLAEVLIVLGIIGVIAAICLPTLIKKYQQHETVTGLKKQYSAMSQVLQRAIADNGDVSDWDWSDLTVFVKTYFIPYMSIMSDCGRTRTDNCGTQTKLTLKGTSLLQGF